MKWFSERSTRQSTKNGTILVRRDLGVWRVSVNDCGQTTDYTHDMWVKAFGRITKKVDRDNIKNVLMLGLGAGGEIKTLHTFFPNCSITAVEYDDTMVTLAKELRLYKPFPFPEVLLGDAKGVVPTIVQKFDIIMLDLFLGEEPSPLSTDAVFISQLKERLTEGGVLLVNVYKRAIYLETPRKLFTHTETWKYKENNLGAFW